MYCRVEWFSTLCDFRKWAHCCRVSIGYIFIISIPKNPRILPRAPAAQARHSFSFHVQKITVTLKMYIIVENFQPLNVTNTANKKTVNSVWLKVSLIFRIYNLFIHSKQLYSGLNNLFACSSCTIQGLSNRNLELSLNKDAILTLRQHM